MLWANPRLRLPSLSRTPAFTTKTMRNVEKFRIYGSNASHSSREVITRTWGCQTTYSAEIGLKFVVLLAKKVAQGQRIGPFVFLLQAGKKCDRNQRRQKDKKQQAYPQKHVFQRFRLQYHRPIPGSRGVSGGPSKIPAAARCLGQTSRARAGRQG